MFCLWHRYVLGSDMGAIDIADTYVCCDYRLANFTDSWVVFFSSIPA